MSKKRQNHITVFYNFFKKNKSNDVDGSQLLITAQIQQETVSIK